MDTAALSGSRIHVSAFENMYSMGPDLRQRRTSVHFLAPPPENRRSAIAQTMADRCRLLKTFGAYMFFARMKRNLSIVIRTLAYLLEWSHPVIAVDGVIGWGQQEAAAKQPQLLPSLDRDNKYQGCTNHGVSSNSPCVLRAKWPQSDVVSSQWMGTTNTSTPSRAKRRKVFIPGLYAA